MSCLLVFGAGGHGKVVAETALASGEWEEVCLVDDRHPELEEVNGLRVIGSFEQGMQMQGDYSFAIAAIGDNALRARTTNELLSRGFQVPVVCHPTTVIASSASIGAGSVLLANVVVQSSAKIGVAVILNTSVSVDHDCNIKDGAHLSPGTHLGGDVTIGEHAFLGVGVSVIRGINIGRDSIIGGGAAVVNDIESRCTAVGVPAKKIKNNESS